MPPFIKRVLIVAGAGIGLLLALLVLMAIFNRRTQVVGLNREIQYDDFAFSVLRVRKAHEIGEGAHKIAPAGLFYIVTLRIANHARRVDYRFKRSSALLVDDFGNDHALSEPGQQALDEQNSSLSTCSDALPAGTDCVTEIVFDVPNNLYRPGLRISEGGLAGDIVDYIIYGKKRIELGPIE